ncbi:TonB-dependent copper receptor [Pelomonas sp. CA6]|uniref:TonB-dependent copper receptor n=1 Tax=Pelomonas sp. CA6 TaxID=2907999 RepID=UPI001F4BCF90|nr:TonB-dependent copper receptor [Pelomonas sp. CA6]MCH7343119.1 TonB-dependent copper receptor [Pelomonas sp. CA6]
MSFRPHPTPVALAIAMAIAASSAVSAPADPVVVQTLAPVVLTTTRMSDPLQVDTDPKAPRQPIPAHDGADLLKSIPGFSVIRKGATDGDPVFRGAAGSRLGILLDGQELYGGCGGRMDPPTAYVYPESYDRVRILKGPQSVRYGAGQSAGVVLFERDYQRPQAWRVSADASLTLARFGRNDQMLDAGLASPDFYLRAGGTRADADNYRDGNGKEIHSFYTRWSSHAALGWTPDADTRAELSVDLSDGEAAYADRGMDGAKFRRENSSLLFEKKRISSLWKAVEARLYRNHADHVMDNYSLRPNPGTAMSYAAMNPDRTTQGGRVSVTLTPAGPWELTLGVDAKQDDHRYRSAMMKGSAQAATQLYLSLPRQYDIKSRQSGVFGEASVQLSEQRKILAGLRVDRHHAEDLRPDGFSAATSPVNTTRGQADKRTLSSGFVRYEQRLPDSGGYVYAGLGHSERFPDYWERLHKSPAGGSVFLSVKPEKLTQLDVGASVVVGALQLSVSGFYGRSADYILLNWDKGQTRNVDTTSYGGELDARYKLSPAWDLTGSLAYVHGQNRTDHKPLAQQPPLELRLGSNYSHERLTLGVLWRLVASQDRFDLGSGNIVANGKDLGPTPGFGVLSLNAGYRFNEKFLLTAGIDNLLDKAYAEHLSRAGQSAGMSGMDLYPPNTRINEPGRTVWAKLQFSY